jgi:putative serine protease PepD
MEKATYPVIGVSVDMQYAGDGARIADTSNAILPGGPASKAGTSRRRFDRKI